MLIEERLKAKYLARLIKGHGRSYVVLQRVLGRPADPISIFHCVGRLGYRLKTAGTIGFMMWFWDIGYMTEAKTPRQTETIEPFFRSVVSATPGGTQ